MKYSKRDLWFDFYKKSDITLTNSYYVLSKISHAGGPETLYSYATSQKWLNEKTECSIEFVSEKEKYYMGFVGYTRQGGWITVTAKKQ